MIMLIVIISLLVQFTHASLGPGMIFGRVADWLETNAPTWLHKPLYDCPICMAPWWGSVYLTIIIYSTDTVRFMDAGIWIVTVFAAGGLNAVISKFERE